MLTVSPPGDFERIVEEVGQPTTDKAPSPSPTGSSDPAILKKVLESCRKNHIDVHHRRNEALLRELAEIPFY